MSYPHELWTTIGADIGHMELTSEERDVIDIALSGDNPFTNKLRSSINNSASNCYSLASKIQARIDDANDPAGGQQWLDLVDTLERIPKRLNEGDQPKNFRKHTDRLSGYTLDGSGELLGFLGLQGVATSYNSIKEAMREDDEDTVDNYSIFFTSVLDSGQNMMADIVEFAPSSTVIAGIYYLDVTDDDLPSLNSTGLGLRDAIYSNIDVDNLALTKGLDYITKFGLGVVALGMNKDTYFGKRLLDEIQTDTLRNELDDIV